MSMSYTIDVNLPQEIRSPDNCKVLTVHAGSISTTSNQCQVFHQECSSPVQKYYNCLKPDCLLYQH